MFSVSQSLANLPKSKRPPEALGQNIRKPSVVCLVIILSPRITGLLELAMMREHDTYNNNVTRCRKNWYVLYVIRRLHTLYELYFGKI